MNWLALLIWMPALAFLGFVGITAFQHRTTFGALSRLIHNSYVFSARDREAVAEVLPESVSNDARLVGEGIPGMIGYANELKPDWIFGVNTGGRALSVRIASAIGLTHERCVYLRSESEAVRVFADPKTVFRGTLLVVDDISRSGDTLAFVKSFLMQHNGVEQFQLQAVRFAVLVIDASPAHSHAEFAPDWARFKTSSADEYVLPWSALSKRIKAGRGEEEQKIAGDAQYAESELLRYIA